MAGRNKAKNKRDKAPIDQKSEPAAGKLKALVCIVWVGLLLVHANKALGFYPLIIPDEYTYISDIRHRPFSADIIPNYLYYWVYSVTGLFGDAFFDSGRILNAFFFMLSAPFIHATARRVCGKVQALVLTLIFLVSPYSIYTAFFMPESLYFTAFWALAWYVTGRDTAMSAKNCAIYGASIALLALIKMHGVFLLPGLFLYILSQATAETWRARLRRAVGLFCAGLAGFAAVRFGLGLLFAGSAGLHILGRGYADLADEGRQAVTLLPFAARTLYNLLGNVLGMGLVTGIPLSIALLCAIGKAPVDDDAGAKLRRMSLFAFSFMIPLLLVSAAFCALMDLHYPDEAYGGVLLIQWRYYNFLFPMFLITAFGFLSALDQDKLPAWRGKRLFLFPFACAVYAASTNFAGYRPATMPDCPELGSLHRFFPVFLVAGLAVAALSLGCVIKTREALRAYLFGAVPLFALIGSGIAQYEAINGYGLFPDLYDKAGMFAKEYLGDECRDLTLVDGFVNNGKKALIHIDTPETDLLPQFDNRVDMSLIKPGKNWLLLTGEFHVPKRYDKFSIVYDDPAQTEELTAFMRLHNNTRVMLRYTLMRITDFDYSVDMSAKARAWPAGDVVSTGDGVRAHYRIPLPKRFSLKVVPGDGNETRPPLALWIGDRLVAKPIAFGREYELSGDGTADTISFKNADGAPGENNLGIGALVIRPLDR